MKFFEKFLQASVIIVMTFVVMYSLRQPILNEVWTLIETYAPCKVPITYSVGKFDERFGISREDFITTMKAAEDIWEKPLGINLFQYKDDGHLKVNLTYDYRQSSTEMLSSLDGVVRDTQGTYDLYKFQLASLRKRYEQDLVAFQNRNAAYAARLAAYNKEVAAQSSHRKTSTMSTDVEREGDSLRREWLAIESAMRQLDEQRTSINQLIDKLNALAKELNLNVATIKEIDASRGEVFQEGHYQSDTNGQSIDVYQFDNENKLLRVLAHEFGHALGLEHVDDETAIMYSLNEGMNDTPSETDITALAALCRRK